MGLENTCVLFDPEGHEVGRYAKNFLWHFDRRWFEPGGNYPVFELEFPRAGATKAGILICSDSRLEEIPRAYAVESARLIIDPTAWVSAGRDPRQLTNPQIDYLMPARAVENGTWVICADKTGSEGDSIVYAGQSGVIAPTGEWVVRAPSAGAGIVTHEFDLDEALGPPIARRPELYADLGVPTDSNRRCTTCPRAADRRGRRRPCRRHRDRRFALGRGDHRGRPPIDPRGVDPERRARRATRPRRHRYARRDRTGDLAAPRGPRAGSSRS